MSYEQIFFGTILHGPDIDPIEGYVCVDNGIITEISEEPTDSKNIIAPCFVNSHTHIGDSVYKDPCLGPVEGHLIKKDLDFLVKPPDGLKHRILSKTSYHTLVDYMRRSICDMLATGTTSFIDFREGGVPGVLALKEALKDIPIECMILGRPTMTEEGNYSRELDRLLERCQGFGMSGANDLDIEMLKMASKRATHNKRLFAIHAGEKDVNDIEKALCLEPDLLIHLTQAKRSHLEKLTDDPVPVVVCPRSNLITGVGMPPISDMLDLGLTVAVGTDNVMLNSVNMFSEMEFISRICGIEDRQVFKMCTLNGASITGQMGNGVIEKGNRSNFMILDGGSNNLSGVSSPVSGIVRRGRPDDILSVIQGSNEW